MMSKQPAGRRWGSCGVKMNSRFDDDGDGDDGDDGDGDSVDDVGVGGLGDWNVG